MATCKECLHFEVCQFHIDEETKMTVNECMHFQDTSKLIKLPCKIGDYIEWDNGVGYLFYFEIIGFEFNTKGEVVRYITNGVVSPIVSHKAIRRIVTKEEAEKALKEREQE